MQTHPDGWIFQLLAKVVIQRFVLDAISGLSSFSSQVGEANRDQHGTGDVVALNIRFSTFVFLDTGPLLDFAVKLLDFPAPATHLLCRMQEILSKVVGHDPIRAVGRPRHPEQLYFVVFRETFDLHESARVATVLPSHQFDPAREILVQHGVVEDDIAIRRGLNL